MNKIFKCFNKIFHIYISTYDAIRKQAGAEITRDSGNNTVTNNDWSRYNKQMPALISFIFYILDQFLCAVVAMSVDTKNLKFIIS